MRILGIDPGMAIVGYGVLDFDKTTDEMNLISSGAIRTQPEQSTSERLFEIYQDMKHLIEKFQPDCCSIEELFFFKNAKTIIPVAEARGVILMALAEAKIPSTGYTPMEIKQALTGHGHAKKPEVAQMVELILNRKISKLDDTADAIAACICHCKHQF